MNKRKQIKMILGLAAMAILLSRSLRTERQDLNPQAEPISAEESSISSEMESPVDPSIEGLESGTGENKVELMEKPESEGSDQALVESALEENLPETDLESETEVDIHASQEAVTEQQNGEEEVNTQPAQTDPVEEIVLVKEEVDGSMTENESDGKQEVESLTEDAVTEIEDSLSVQDYAKGLSLLAKLPVETVDRFVELRKDGFTVEEQAEVKAILLDSYEGEDLEWIVQMYHKLQP